ncbi:MAG: SGNH/GDSL hydrolase family protein [Eggerthellaceae bacterium]|jgi:lysophospholipase L1-like esterase
MERRENTTAASERGHDRHDARQADGRLRVLMLGNSFTSANDLPHLLEDRLGGRNAAVVVAHTRGGARLAEHLNPQTKMGAATQRAFAKEPWNFVVLQEMSNGPITSPARFQESSRRLCAQIRAIGAMPVFYATWAYKEGCARLAKLGVGYRECYEALHDAYVQAARENDALLADVGTAFFTQAARRNLYAADGCHPNECGSQLAAHVLAQTIQDGPAR